MSIDHLVLTVTDLTRSEPFYTAILGPTAYKTERFAMYLIGETKFFVQMPENVLPDRFNPRRVGIDHVAFHIKHLDELLATEKKLNSAGIAHSGIHVDKHSNKEKIWLDDPDGIRLEFYIPS